MRNYTVIKNNTVLLPNFVTFEEATKYARLVGGVVISETHLRELDVDAPAEYYNAVERAISKIWRPS